MKKLVQLMTVTLFIIGLTMFCKTIRILNVEINEQKRTIEVIGEELETLKSNNIELHAQIESQNDINIRQNDINKSILNCINALIEMQ